MLASSGSSRRRHLRSMGTVLPAAALCHPAARNSLLVETRSWPAPESAPARTPAPTHRRAARRSGLHAVGQHRAPAPIPGASMPPPVRPGCRRVPDGGIRAAARVRTSSVKHLPGRRAPKAHRRERPGISGPPPRMTGSRRPRRRRTPAALGAAPWAGTRRRSHPAGRTGRAVPPGRCASSRWEQSASQSATDNSSPSRTDTGSTSPRPATIGCRTRGPAPPRPAADPSPAGDIGPGQPAQHTEPLARPRQGSGSSALRQRLPRWEQHHVVRDSAAVADCDQVLRLPHRRTTSNTGRLPNWMAARPASNGKAPGGATISRSPASPAPAASAHVAAAGSLGEYPEQTGQRHVPKPRVPGVRPIPQQGRRLAPGGRWRGRSRRGGRWLNVRAVPSRWLPSRPAACATASGAATSHS